MSKNHSTFHLIFIFCLSLIFACSSSKKAPATQESNNNTDSIIDNTPKEQSLIRLQKFEFAQISTNNSSLQIIPGTHQVFELSFSPSGSSPETDLGFTQKLVFQTPMKVTHFTLNENSFKNNNAFWGRLCKCDDSGYMPIKTGNISLVNGDSLKLEYNISFSGHTTNKNYEKHQTLSLIESEINTRSLKKGQEYEAYKGKIHSNKSLENRDPGNVRIIEGKNYVVEFSRQTGPNPKTDMGFYEKVLIELTDLNNGINISGEDIKNLNAYYGRLCRCMNSGYNKLTGGSIIAKPKDHTKWAFNISVNAIGRHDSTAYKIDISTDVEINPNNINIKQPLVIDSKQYKSCRQDPFELLEASIESGKIRCKVKYSGGCQGADFKLLSPEITDQKIIKLKLGFEDNDHCRSIVTKNIYFDLKPLNETNIKGPVQLIINETHSLSYIVN